MNLLKQSTAATVKIGPFLDDTDGKTAETGLTISQADIRLSKNGGAFAQTNNATGATHDENGFYGVPLDTTDTGTLGRLRVAVSESGALPVWQDFLVVTANVYDTFCSTDQLDVNVVQVSGDSTAADNLELDYDGTGYNKSNSTIGTCTTNTDMRGTDSAYTGTPPSAADIVNEWESQAQADPTGFHVNVMEVNGTAQTANDNGADINAILVDTNELQGLVSDSKIAAQVKGLDDIDLSATMKTSVNAEVDTALNTAIPGSPTANSINERVAAIDDKLPSKDYLAGTANSDGDVELDAATGALSSTAIDAIWDRASNHDSSLSFETLLVRVYKFLNHKMLITDATGAVALRNIADSADIATQSITDNDTTTTRTVLTWA